MNASKEQDAPTLGPMLLEELLRVSFDGASGPVSFDSKGDRQGITLKIENQVDGVEKKVSWQTETPTNVHIQ